jgi:uncharacterized protein YjbI with pentapeptide repeats
MYAPRPCEQKGCGRPALAESTRCVVHHPDAVAHVKEILRAARSAASLRDLDLTGAIFEDEDLGGMEISGCRLTAASFTRVRFCGAFIQLSFLDRATLRDCDFSGVGVQNAVFAGSTIEGCRFTDSEIILGNFLGISGTDIAFDHSDLYGSRFIGSWLEKVSMRDCNLTRAHFDSAHRAIVDFHLSNTNEAVFIEVEP